MKPANALFSFFLIILAAGGMAMNPPTPEEVEAQQQIQSLRTTPLTLEVVDAAGKPLPGATVQLLQRSHAFRFGCAVQHMVVRKDQPPELREKLDAYRLKWQKLFNFATTENAIKWPQFEPEEGKLDTRFVEGILEFTELAGASLKGHNLVWGGDTGEWVPQWLLPKSPEEVKTIVDRHVPEVVNLYKDRIHTWDVVNEMLHCHWFDRMYGPDYVAEALRMAHQADPAAELLINDFGEYWGDTADQYAALVKRLLAEGAPLDAVGLQAHDPPYWYPPQEIRRVLDTVASAGLPLHITEFTYPSDGREITGGWRKGVWDEETQAEYYRYFYTLCFAHPAVEAITMWAAWDASTWLKQGGVLRPDLSEKPAYQVLDELINQVWHTEGTFTADEDGQVSLPAFKGEYKLEARLGGKSTGPVLADVLAPTTVRLVVK